MLQKAFFYLVGLLIVGATVAYLTSLVLEVLPYLAVSFVILIPFYGAVRRQKQWDNHTASSVKTWLTSFWKVLKFGKPSLTFYLILGVAGGFVLPDMVWMLSVTLLLCVGGILGTYGVWESIRWALKTYKGKEIMSYSEAMKSAW